MALAPRIDSIQAGQNLVINGNFDFHQRLAGDPLTLSSGLLYSADRFAHQKSASYTGSSTAQRSTNVPTVAQSGFKSNYSLLVTNGTGLASPGASDFYAGYIHFLEGYDFAQLHAKPARLQFWVNSSVTGTFTVSFRNASANRSYLATYSIFSANTWEKKSIDLTFDSAGTWLFDNGRGLIIQWTLSAGSSLQDVPNVWVSGNKTFAVGSTNWAGTTGATFYLSQVMIVQGAFDSNVDLPFKRAGRTISDELAMCQRYCEKLERKTGQQSLIGMAYIVTSSVFIAQTPYKVTKRSNSINLVQSGLSNQFILTYNGTGQAFNSLTIFGETDEFSARTGNTGMAGLTPISGAGALAFNADGAYLIFDCEL